MTSSFSPSEAGPQRPGLRRAHSLAPPRYAHGDLTSLAPHERLPEILVVPSCDPQKSPDTPGSPEGNTEGPGTASGPLGTPLGLAQRKRRLDSLEAAQGLAITNSAAVNIGVHVSLSILVSSVCIPNPGIKPESHVFCISRWVLYC